MAEFPREHGVLFSWHNHKHPEDLLVRNSKIKFNNARFLRHFIRMDSDSAQRRSPRKAADSVAVDSSTKQQLHASGAKLGLSSADLRDRPLKQDGKKLLIHSDSGYISPTVAPASNGNSPQTPSKEPLKVTFQTGTIDEEPAKTKSPEVGRSTGLESIERQEIQNRKADDMQRMLARESRVEQVQRSLAAESVSPCLKVHS